MTDSTKSNAEKVGLCINTSKTKIQRTGNWNNNTTPITVDKRLLEEVQSFKYLSSYRTSDSNVKVDLKNRIEKGSAVVKQLHQNKATSAYVYRCVHTTYASDTHTFQLPSSSKGQVYNEPSILRGRHHGVRGGNFGFYSL